MTTIVRSFGTVLMFLPMSMTSLGPIPKKDVRRGDRLLTTSLASSAAASAWRSSRPCSARGRPSTEALIEHLVVTDPNVQARVDGMTASFVAKGADVAVVKQRALTMLDGAARVQGSVLAFNDTFFVTARLVLASIPLVILLGKPKAGNAIDAGAH